MFKSDRCGIEIYLLHTLQHKQEQFKSDRCGIEMLMDEEAWGVVGAFKSDRCGIEIQTVRLSLSAGLLVQIRPLRD